MQKVPTKFPTFMYHKEHVDPKRVDTADQAKDLMTHGWVNRYLWKEYPKMVNGVLCNDKATEDILLKADAAKAEVPKVVKETIVSKPSGEPVLKIEDGKVSAHKEPVKKVQVQVARPEKMEFEILSPGGDVIPDLQFSTWKEAQSTQSELNKNAPGHKARKMKDEG